jgi:putative ABC transport system ATP-binding protein
VDAVALNGAGHVHQVFVDHGDKRCVVLLGEVAEDLVEPANVIRAVIGRKRDAGEQHLDMRGGKSGENVIETLAALFEGETAEAVVAAEFDDYDGWTRGENGANADCSVLGGGAAGALIFNGVLVAALAEIALQGRRIGLVGLKPKAGCNTVAIADDHRAFSGDQRKCGCDQTKRNEKLTPNVHTDSVKLCKDGNGRHGKRVNIEDAGEEAWRVIEVRNVKRWIQNGSRRVDILKGISLSIPAGQFVAIVGASGSGKSTLLGLLAGLDTPSEGEIWLDGTPIHNLAEGQLAAVRGRKIGFVFQSYQLISTLTALENVLLPFELNVEGHGLERARELLEAVGLGERMDHYPVQLSGGEQQRVALARAFVVNPPIVMADEPTGNLDSANGRLVLDLLLERHSHAGATLVLVTHDPEIASRADRKIVLKDGMIIEDTLPSPAEVVAQSGESHG